MTITNNSLGKLTFGPPSVVIDGLVTYLDAASIRSYPGGTVWKDLSGNDNDFTIYGSVSHNGTIFTLDGSTSQYFQANPFPHPTENFTIELYQRVNEINLTPFYSYAVDSDSNEGLLYITNNSGRIVYVYGPSGRYSTGYAISTEVFYQITRTRSSSTGEDKFYINGTLIATATQAAGTQTVTDGSFNIGQEQDSVGGGFRDTQTFNGDVALLRVYDRALTAQEINDNYQLTKSRFE